MLRTKQQKIIVPAFFESRMSDTSKHIKELFAHEPNAAYQLHFEDFYEDFCECISEFHAAITKYKYVNATKIIDHFYTKWLDTPLFPERLNTMIDVAMASALATLVMVHLSVELAYITKYSISTACGLTMLFIRVGLKVTTPEWIAVGSLSGGLFNCKTIRTRPTQGKSHRLFST